MRTPVRIVTAGAAMVAAAGLFAAPANATPSQHRHHHGAAVFVQTDNLAGNTVIAYDRGTDGGLHRAGVYRTGGLGGQLGGSVVDHTASQGALAYDRAHHLLYAVNAGSNTITVFRVDGDRLHRVQVVGSGGTFPVSVTFHRGLVYVLNARDGGSVQGFLRWGDRLVRIPSWHRDLRLDLSAAPEFVAAPGQVAFTPDGADLVVTTKASGNSIEVFRINWFGGPSDAPVITPDPGNVPFAVTFGRHDQLIVAEAANSTVATYRLHRSGTLQLQSRVATGQAATCWITGTRGRVYVSNAGSATVSGYRVGRTGTLSGIGTTGTGPGTVDSAVTPNGRFLYVQTGEDGGVAEFRINPDGSLTAIGSVTVPGAVGGEGIVAS